MPPQPHYDPLFARPPGTWRLSMPRPTGIPGYQVWGRMGHPFFSEELDTDVFGNDDSSDSEVEEGRERLIISIDFGATSSGVAYALSKDDEHPDIKMLTDWPGSIEPCNKFPSSMLYAEDSKTVRAWGFEAKAESPSSNIPLTELFKLCIDKRSLKGRSETLSIIPHNGNLCSTLTDFLSKIWQHAREKISSEFGEYMDVRHVWITVPPGWSPDSVRLVRRAAIDAGLVTVNGLSLPKRLHTMSEAEATVIYTYDQLGVGPLSYQPHPPVVCDVGGACTTVTIFKSMEPISTYSKIMCGGMALERKFRKYMETKVKKHPKLRESLSLDHFVSVFIDSVKYTFRGEENDDTMYDFPCPNCDTEDLDIHLKDGRISLRGYFLRKEVFEPVVNKILKIIRREIDKQRESDPATISDLFVVGGFSTNYYFLERVKEMSEPLMLNIIQPEDAECSVLRGAVLRGLDSPSRVRRFYNLIFIAPYSYIMKVRAPAEEQDRLNRPHYIRTNEAGKSICEKRLQYLVKKGAKIRDGKRVVTRLSKFSKTFSDCIFPVVICANETAEIFRYTDEANLTEICKFEVDLSALPGFQSNGFFGARNFYTEFEIGLEFPTEGTITCLLLYNGMVCGPPFIIDVWSKTHQLRRNSHNDSSYYEGQSPSEIQIRLD